MLVRAILRWCGRSDSNRHSFGEQVFETCASTGSATPAQSHRAGNPNQGFIPWTRLTFESTASTNSATLAPPCGRHRRLGSYFELVSLLRVLSFTFPFRTKMKSAGGALGADSP